MTFHKDQLFFDGDTSITDETSADLQVGPGEYDLTAVVKEIDGAAEITILESADDSTYVALATFPAITEVGTYHRKVTTQLEYLRMTVDPGTSIKLVAGPTRGRDGAAN
jgi:hypothetical protein